MESEKKSSALHNFIISHREKMFLYMCLGVHLAFLFSFSFGGIWSLAAVNLIGVILYIFFLRYAYKNNATEKMMIVAYFEVIGFCAVSETLTHGCMEYYPYILGVISGIVYVTPSYKKKHFLIQIAGMIAVLGIFLIKNNVPESMFSKTYTKALPLGKSYSHINLLITLCTIVYSAFFYEIELTASRKELDYNSTHDILTGLYNRRFLYDLISKNDDRSFSVAILDIDHFKRINDSFGHDKGDDVLVSVSGIISEYVKNDDQTAVRWGGEEFIIYFYGADAESLHSIVSEICRKISENVILPDSSAVTLTAGVSAGTGKNLDKAVKQADEYLYAGKQNGRNCIVWDKNKELYQNETSEK